MTSGSVRESPHDQRRRLARLLLTVFLLTFLLARIVVLLIMTRRMPDLFLHVGGTHVHHLNYGIVLLAASGAWMLFAPPEGRTRTRVATAYAIGLALTFDEFGMWLHLGGGYWQRASFDAVVVIATILALLAFLPAPRALRPRQLAAAVIVLAGVAVFGRLVYETLDHAGQRVAPALREIEDAAPK
ncbi:MAG: hypothetical protein EOP90_02370 [Lysobacteraceae bacterium]|nr:MAG: hypothetical protein EOP90_02370 [Xanthomonadaceae bacterium]